jgi:hypothetical protein
MPWPLGPDRTAVVTALDPPHTRTNWPENLAFGAPNNNNLAPRPGWDVSPTGTTQGQREHRVWLEAGTWRAVVEMLFDSGAPAGTFEALIDSSSLGTVNGAGETGGNAARALPNAVVVGTSGVHNVVIRKTTANGAVSFLKLTLRRTA